jgi:SAM-dependent methyltransferase
MANVSSTFPAANGDDYELQMGRWSRILASSFLDFTSLSDSGSILDAGCGTGALCAEILRRTKFAKVVGTDISEDYIAHASASTGDPRVVFKTGDLTSLPFSDGSFSQVFSQLVLLFVPDTDKAISELIRVTELGGTVSAATWDSRGGLTSIRFFMDTAAMLDTGADKLRQRMFTRPLTRPGELANAWEAAGLVDLKAGEITIRTDFASFEDYWAPYEGEDGVVPAYLRSVTPEMGGQIKDAVRRAYLDGEADGLRSYTATAWVASGKKANLV